MFDGLLSEMHHAMLGKRRDLSIPSAANLSYILRRRRLWPPGFRWKFISVDGCAIGLAYRLWFGDEAAYLSPRLLACLGLPYAVALQAFGGPHRGRPQDVAAVIDAYLARQRRGQPLTPSSPPDNDITSPTAPAV